MKRTAIAAAALVLALAGCTSTAPTGDEALLAEQGLDRMTGQEIVDHLDRLGGAERPTDFMASVRVDELLVFDGERELSVELPGDEFYLAFAPYVNQTHDCYYHSLTTCQGELVQEDVQVTIVDDATGEVLFDEVATTFANGFVGYWLPRDIEATLTVTYDGLSLSEQVATGPDDPTCVTTTQLT